MEENVYGKINNPLDNKRFINEILYDYIYYPDMYYAFVLNKDSNQRNKKSIVFHDILLVNTYNDWINNLGKYLEDNSNYELELLYDYLSKHNVRNTKDLFSLINTNNIEDEGIIKLINKYCPIVRGRDEYFINSKDFKSDNSPRHSLYLNCDVSKMHLLLYRLYEKCKEKGLDYCVKFNESGLRSDSIIIYCDTDNLSLYIKLIEEVIDENDLNSSMMNVPTSLGIISKNIGYGSIDHDYISRRSNHIKECIDRETSEWIYKNFESTIKTSTGRNIPYKYFLFSKIITNKKLALINGIKSGQSDYSLELINSREFSYIMTKGLLNELKSIIRAIINNDYNYKVTIPFYNIHITFTYSELCELLRTQADYFKNNEEYQNNIIRRIKSTSTVMGIDSNNYGVDIEDSYILGKEKPIKKSKVTIEDLNNFDTSRYETKKKEEVKVKKKNKKKVK